MPATTAHEIPRLHEVQEVISAAALTIRSIVMARVREIEDDFPSMEFATDFSHDVSSDAIGDHSVFKVEAWPGIPLTSRENMWHGRPYMVALMPTGIHKYPYVRGDAGRSFPHLLQGAIDDRLWVQYGTYALSLLHPRPVTSAIRERRIPKGLVADIGQEYCRWCQHVALAREFRFENQCPKCSTNSWLYQYGVEVD